MSSGLLVTIAGVLSTDVLRGRVRDFRVAAVVAGVGPLALSVGLVTLDLSRTVGLVFAGTLLSGNGLLALLGITGVVLSVGLSSQSATSTPATAPAPMRG